MSEDHHPYMVAPAYCEKREKQSFDCCLLLLEAELLDKGRVSALIVLLEVSQVCAAISNHLEKTTATVKVLLVLLEVISELINLAAKNGYLYIGRAGVLVVAGRILNYRRLYSFCKH